LRKKYSVLTLSAFARRSSTSEDGTALPFSYLETDMADMPAFSPSWRVLSPAARLAAAIRSLIIGLASVVYKL
jgi:hypothetical protein